MTTTAEQIELTAPVETKITAPALSEAALVDLLAQRYAAPQYAFLHHVRNSTGFARVTRTADAMAMGLWPSRGLHLTGFEIKSSRSDWLSELKNPAKADEIARFCDFWVLVCGKPGIVQLGELPAAWGLIEANSKGKLAMKVEPKSLDPKPISRGFLAAILRRASESSPSETAIHRAVSEAKEELHAQYVASEKRDSDRSARALQDLQRAVDTFQEKSGIRIDRWDGGHIGEAVRQFMRASVDADSLLRLAEQAEQIARDARAGHAVLRTVDVGAAAKKGDA